MVLQEKQKYEIMANTFKSLDDVINLFCELHDRYPGIIAIVDGVRSPVSSPQTTSVSSFGTCAPSCLSLSRSESQVESVLRHLFVCVDVRAWRSTIRYVNPM